MEKKILVVGNGIAGLSAAIRAARAGMQVLLVSAALPERSQSVMAAGGINAALNTVGEGDSPELHVADTVKGGCGLEDEAAVQGLCRAAPGIVEELARIGVIFNRQEDETLALRAFGGQSRRRTAYAGSSTGKQIVSALVRQLRQYESSGRVRHLKNRRFLSAMVEDGVCCGAYFLHERGGGVEAYEADGVIMATGGQNRLFGKTTGSMLCDGAAAARLFLQGARLRNPEFIQYHPTTIETPGKRMLISEAARGEGGRLFYEENGRRVYFMEEKYGPNGNLMPRDIVSKEIYDAPGPVYLDISFLDGGLIDRRLAEVDQLCRDYLNLDVKKSPIPVYPSVHFFMGGLAVDAHHATDIARLYAVGECASAYHGANRLGGNSLLAAIYGAECAVSALREAGACRPTAAQSARFEAEREALAQRMRELARRESKFPAVYIMEETAHIMQKYLGITRTEERLRAGLAELDFLQGALEKLVFDGTLSPYESYALPSMVTLAKTITLAALNRRETRGAHIRTDYPQRDPRLARPTFAAYEEGRIRVWIGERHD